MHAVALRALCTAQRPISRRACRIIGGVRYPLPQRNFHRSAISYRIPEDPAISEAEKERENQEVESEAEKVENDGPDGVKSNREIENLAVSQRARNGRIGTGRVRGNRMRQAEGLPPVLLPDWFWENNVKLVGDPDLGGSLAVYGNSSGEDLNDGLKADLTRQMVSIVECDLESTKDAKYSIHVDVYMEILAALRAGLALRPPKNSANQQIPRAVTVLQCPKDGGTFYLDSVVETLAKKLGADLIRLDAQNIAQIVGPYTDENLAWTRPRTSILSYDAQRVAGKLEEYDKDPETAQEDMEEAEEEDDVSIMPRGGRRAGFAFPKPAELSKQLASIFSKGSKNDFGKSRGSSSFGIPGMSMVEVFHAPTPGEPAQMLPSSESDWNGLKLSNAFETMINAADMKRASASIEAGNAEPSTADTTPRDIIMQIRDYKELNSIPLGAEMLSRLRTLINKRWQDGRNIICVGTTSSEEGEPALARSEIQHLQSDIDGEKRTIFVPPDRREEQDVAFETDEKARIRNINIRHIEDMIAKMADGTQKMSVAIDIEKDLDSAAVYAAGMEDAVWTYARVHRLATTILGLEPSISSIDGVIFSKALKLLASSDEAKFTWGAAELKEEDADVENMMNDLAEAGNSTKNKTKDKIKQIRKTCTPHEKKLLGGVVMPSDIHTTFDDIRAPKETVEALKTLTSLSLIRPEAFSYGVLATDKIPGLLLYGPPGTGKTLLAKAVAKESGAIVLEVSGADVNDMFVGEGEKNVKAVFSLAKKLSPCVVFIDEADAIFASRGEAKRTGSHRELINQFLREWDGMNDLSAFIMVATNRPFDLDEAVLRRLPRRLLVDLPVEKDREAILKIHLKDEVLDESVSLAKLAKDTPFYSGSDLKNLAVAAALACIKQENAAASMHTGDEPYMYPEKRTLTKAHFDKAMEEISASISEDMSTLTAIRKFDEKYGDRKGRRKKGNALGFGGTQVVEKDSEAARVRKMEAN